MFTGNEDMEATALRARGWSISAIARHLGRSRETVRHHLNGTRTPGVRKRWAPDPFVELVPYLGARFADDPHVWASALYDEVTALGYPASYPSFTRGLRTYGLRPHCEACQGVKGRSTIEIDHPPGEEIQWDWDELAGAPWGDDAHLLLGTLPCSGKTRGVFCEAEDQAHLIEGIDAVLRRLGGSTRDWRFDRMSTVVDPATGIVRRSFVPVAKHYGARVVVCPPRRGNRKGSVEKGVHFSSERYWRTMTTRTMGDAQGGFDRFCEKVGDGRPRSIARLAELAGGEDRAAEYLAAHHKRRPTVGDLAGFERLSALPAAPYPARVEVQRRVERSCLVAFEANAYSVPTGLVGTEVTVRHRLGTEAVEVLSSGGAVLASHRRHTPGSGYVVRDDDHRAALEHEVLATFTTVAPCKKKANRPPGEAARAEAAKLLASFEDAEVVVDLAVYQSAVEMLDDRGAEATR